MLLWEVNTRVRRGKTGIVFTVYWNRLKSVQFFTSGVAQISLCGSYISHLSVSRWNGLVNFQTVFSLFPLILFSVKCWHLNSITSLYFFFKRHRALRYWYSLSKILLQHFQSHFPSFCLRSSWCAHSHRACLQSRALPVELHHWPWPSRATVPDPSSALLLGFVVSSHIPGSASAAPSAHLGSLQATTAS